MYLYGCEIQEIEPVIKNRYQCNRAIKLGSGTYYLGNMFLNENTNPVDINVMPVENGHFSARASEDAEIVMIPDNREKNRRTFFIAYPIPENTKLIRVNQRSAALRFNLNDNGMVCYVGRELPECYTITDNVVLSLRFQGLGGGKITVIDFVIDKNHTITANVTTRGSDNTTAQYERNFVDCYAIDRFRSRVKIPNGAVVFANSKAKFNKPYRDVINTWLAGGLRDNTSIVVVNSSDEIANALREILPTTNMRYEIMFYGFQFESAKKYRNMFRSMLEEYKSEQTE